MAPVKPHRSPPRREARTGLRRSLLRPPATPPVCPYGTPPPDTRDPIYTPTYSPPDSPTPNRTAEPLLTESVWQRVATVFRGPQPAPTPPCRSPSPPPELQSEPEQRVQNDSIPSGDPGQPSVLYIPPPDAWAELRARLTGLPEEEDSEMSSDVTSSSSDSGNDVDSTPDSASVSSTSSSLVPASISEGSEDEVELELSPVRYVTGPPPPPAYVDDAADTFLFMGRAQPFDLSTSDDDLMRDGPLVRGDPRRRLKFMTRDGADGEIRKTLVAAYFPPLAAKRPNCNGSYLIPGAESAVVYIAFGIVLKPGILHELVRDKDAEGPVSDEERVRIAQRWTKTLQFFTQWASERGVKRLRTALHIMVHHAPDSIDAETAFVLACQANCVAAAYDLLVEYRRVSFVHSGTRNSLFARALRAMPEDCAERTLPESWNKLLPKPYRLAVQLAGERWNPITHGKKFARAFITLSLQLVYATGRKWTIEDQQEAEE